MIIPAIDIMNSKIVRLTQGDFKKTQFYPGTVCEAIRSYTQQGAKLVHLVDLDGARAPSKRQWNKISEWVKSSPIDLQIGGGFRTIEDIVQAIEIGVKRVVVSSLFVENPETALELLKKFPERLVFAADVRFQKETAFIATRGWTELNRVPAKQWIEKFYQAGLQTLLSTDVSRDGMKLGPNINLYKDLRESFPQIEIIASGGVTTLQDIQNLKGCGANAMVIGRALLENDLTYREAQQCWLNE